MNKTIKLNSGYEMPLLGLGTYKSDSSNVGEAVKYALVEAGYKHIDGHPSTATKKKLDKSMQKFLNRSSVKMSLSPANYGIPIMIQKM
jgi:diketogulonate reductase-like aldo/keto reductase